MVSTSRAVIIPWCLFPLESWIRYEETPYGLDLYLRPLNVKEQGEGKCSFRDALLTGK